MLKTRRGSSELSQNVPNRLLMSQNVNFKRIIVRTDLFTTLLSLPQISTLESSVRMRDLEISGFRDDQVSRVWWGNADEGKFGSNCD